LERVDFFCFIPRRYNVTLLYSKIGLHVTYPLVSQYNELFFIKDAILKTADIIYGHAALKHIVK
jgi:hypothetical protein